MAVTFTVDIVNILLSICYLYENGGGKRQVFWIFFAFFFLMRNQAKHKSFSQNCKKNLQSKEHLLWDADWWQTSLFLSFVSSIEVLVRLSLLWEEKIRVYQVSMLPWCWFFYFIFIYIAWSIFSWHNRRKNKIQVKYIVLQSFWRRKKKTKTKPWTQCMNTFFLETIIENKNFF